MAMLALLQHPDQLALVRSGTMSMRSVVDELLRFDAPVQITQRTALADIEVGGANVAPGDQVIVLLGAANRDPAAFTDPDRLDVARNDHRHLAFGGGIHHCLGAALARTEGEVAIRRARRPLRAHRDRGRARAPAHLHAARPHVAPARCALAT